MSASPKNRSIVLNQEEKAQLLKKCLIFADSDSGQPGSFANSCLGQVVCGDCLQVMAHLPKGLVDLAVVDPPYNLTKTYATSRFFKAQSKDYLEFSRRWLDLLKPLLKPRASLYVCCDWRTGLILAPLLQEYFVVQNRLTWQREKGRGAKSNWKNSLEDIWFLTQGSQYTFNLQAVKQCRRVVAPYRQDSQPKDWQESQEGRFRLTCPSNFWDDITVPYWSMPENTAHPTQKPEKLLAKLILASSNSGDLVFDPFLGSGTTAVVAKKLGRNFIAIERESDYCCLARRRLDQAQLDSPIQGYSQGLFWERNTLAWQKQSHVFLDS